MTLPCRSVEALSSCTASSGDHSSASSTERSLDENQKKQKQAGAHVCTKCLKTNQQPRVDEPACSSHQLVLSGYQITVSSSVSGIFFTDKPKIFFFLALHNRIGRTVAYNQRAVRAVLKSVISLQKLKVAQKRENYVIIYWPIN